MKVLKLFLFIIIFVFFSFGCTEQERIRNFGGTGTYELPAGKKLVNATWKDDNLWILTRDMTPKDTLQTYTFSESSSFGVWEGTIILKEHR
ncbi:hypothetical protein C4565_04740 [Candidatus Parcubacteria bacterium]|jgi:hypothetical protein|nr:MAG: hypothetical protein C4565_04740 [Candidatus Parcubacteria bacterium]